MNSQKYEKLIELAAKSGYDKRKDVRAAIFRAVLHDDEDFLEAIEQKLIAKAEDTPNYFPMNKDSDFPGDVKIGKTSWGSQVRIDSSTWTPSLILGSTRSGKSTLITRIAHEIKMNTDAALLFYDPKRSLRSLTKIHDDIYAVSLDKFPFNPFSATKSLTKKWLQDFAGVISQTGDLLTGSRSFILSVLKDLKSKFENKDRQPTMFDFLTEAQKKQLQFPFSNPSYKYGARICNRLEGKLFGFHDTFAYEYGCSVEEILNPSTNIILEADGLDPILSKMVFLEILFSIYYHQLSTGNRGKGIDIFVFIDEAEEILGQAAQKNRALGVPLINRLWERATELKIGLIASVHTTRINPTVRENAKSRFCFNLSSSEDVAKVARDYGLNEDQQEEIEDLKPGEVVAKLKGEFHEPFKMKVDYISLEPVSDKEIHQDNKKLWSKIRDQIVPWQGEQKTKAEKSKQDKEQVSKSSHVLLENIAKFPYLSISQRKDKLGWSNSKLSRVRKKLRQQGYIRKKKLNKPEGGRGSSLTLLEATGKARNYLTNEGIRTKYIGRGGAVHSYYMQWFVDNLKAKNVDVSYETDLGGISVDLFIVKQSGKTQAIEVDVSSTTNTLDKLEKLLEMVDRVLIVSNKKVLVDEFKEKIKEMSIDQDRVSVRKIQEIEF